MNNRQKEIVEYLLLKFECSYLECNSGCNKQIEFEGKKYIIPPSDYEVIIDLIKNFGGEEIRKSYIPSNFHEIAQKYCNGEIFLYEASEECGLSEETFRSKLKKYNYVKTKRKKNGLRYNLPNLKYIAKKYREGEYSQSECGRLLGITQTTFMKYLIEYEKKQSN